MAEGFPRCMKWQPPTERVVHVVCMPQGRLQADAPAEGMPPATENCSESMFLTRCIIWCVDIPAACHRRPDKVLGPPCMKTLQSVFLEKLLLVIDSVYLASNVDPGDLLS